MDLVLDAVVCIEVAAAATCLRLSSSHTLTVMLYTDALHISSHTLDVTVMLYADAICLRRTLAVH
eukprot:1158608-Pelagomonas_calceolata.AAC.8